MRYAWCVRQFLSYELISFKIMGCGCPDCRFRRYFYIEFLIGGKFTSSERMGWLSLS